jgi:hypothetical protein
MSKLEGKPAKGKARPATADEARKDVRQSDGEIEKNLGVHALFRKTLTMDPARREMILSIIETSLQELYPEATKFNIDVYHADPFRFDPDHVDAPAAFVQEKPKGGTVGAVVEAMERDVRLKMRAESRFVGDKFHDWTAKGWSLFRLVQFGDSLIYHAGSIPVGDFGPAEWLAFVAKVPENFRNMPEFNSFRHRMKLAGLNVGKPEPGIGE